MALAETILGTLETAWTIFIYTWWLFLIVIMFVAKKRGERYPIEAVILEKRGENLVKTNDRLGKVEDKHAEMSYYRLKKSKETIPVYSFEWVLHTAKKPMGILDRISSFFMPTTGTAFLFKYGSRQYKPLNIENNPEAKLKLKEIKGKNGETLYVQNFEQFDPRWVVGALNFEVVDWDNMNFMVQEQRASIVRRTKKGDFWKQMAIPAMMIVGALLIAIFILKFSADAGADLRSGSGAAPPQQGGGSIVLDGIGGAVTLLLILLLEGNLEKV